MSNERLSQNLSLAVALGFRRRSGVVISSVDSVLLCCYPFLFWSEVGVGRLGAHFLEADYLKLRLLSVKRNMSSLSNLL